MQESRLPSALREVERAPPDPPALDETASKLDAEPPGAEPPASERPAAKPPASERPAPKPSVDVEPNADAARDLT